MWTGLGIGLVVLVFVAWPLLHGALLAEAVRVFTGRRAELGRVVAAVLVTPFVVFAVGLGVGCVGGMLPVAVSTVGSLIVGVLVRAGCYAGLLRIPAHGAFGLSVGVTLISFVLGSLVLGTVFASVWMAGLTA
jgi:hypothetical protein